MDWIADWLEGRHQRTVLNGEFSDWAEVLSRVPQGSVLGPLAFIIFINDIDDTSFNITIMNKFADDTKLANRISSQVDAHNLQITLDNLVQWSFKWGMMFNTDKCKVMHVGRNNEKYEYFMDGKKLSVIDNERDVGVIVSNDLKPTLQCKEAARRANGVLTQISRSFHYRDKGTFVQLYKQYVRPHLEYGVAAWSPWTRTDIELLEQVQIRAVRMISGLSGRSYRE